MFIEHLIHAKHCSKCFIGIIIFNLYNPRRQILYYYYSHLTDEEIKV